MAETLIPKVEDLERETILADSPLGDTTARPVRPEAAQIVAVAFAQALEVAQQLQVRVKLIEGYRAMTEADNLMAEADMASGFETLPRE